MTLITILSTFVLLQLNNKYLPQTMQFLMINMTWNHLKPLQHPVNTVNHTTINQLTNVLPLNLIGCVTQKTSENSPRITFSPFAQPTCTFWACHSQCYDYSFPSLLWDKIQKDTYYINQIILKPTHHLFASSFMSLGHSPTVLSFHFFLDFLDFLMGAFCFVDGLVAGGWRTWTAGGCIILVPGVCCDCVVALGWHHESIIMTLCCHDFLLELLFAGGVVVVGLREAF